jgi:acetyltransferase
MTDDAATPPNMERLLSPRSIAMVGASNNATSIGGQVFANLVRAFERGPVIPIHPRDAEVQGKKAYASVSELPEAVDMVVVSVPAPAVPGVIAEAAEKGIGGATVITSGFAEGEAGGTDLQQQITDIARASGLRVIGPNCIGFLNLWGGVMANFALPPTAPLPPPGPVALVSQSGGFGSYITLKSMLAGVRLGFFVSTGNEADVNLAAVLSYLVEREDTKVLMVFSETLRDPEVFIDFASRAAELDKPVMLLKAGRSEAAAKAALSHTASIVGSAGVLDAVCRQYGVYVVKTMEELLDLGTIFQDGRRVADRNVGIMTSSGGAGVLLADAAVAEGLNVPEIPRDEQDAMLAMMPTPFYGSTANPVDTTAQVVNSPGAYDGVVGAVLNSRVVSMLAPVTWAGPAPSNETLIKWYQSTTKPVALTSTAWWEGFQAAGLPTYTDPHRAMHALGVLADFSLREPDLSTRRTWAPDPARQGAARALLDQVGGHRSLLESTSKALLALYGVPVTSERLVASAEEAVAAAAAIGGPVALKVMSYELPHKTEYGAIRLGLRDATSIRAAYAEMLAEVAQKAPHAVSEGVLVQEMVPARIELTCGIVRDPVFGPMVSLGLGGVLVEVLAEQVLLRPPFTMSDAHRTIGQLLGGRLAHGNRGLSVDERIKAAHLMEALGNLALELPEVAEVDVNPIMVADDVVCAADALIVLDERS